MADQPRGKRRRRILFIAHHGDLFFGGANLSLFHIIKRLDRSLYEPVVVCPSWASLGEELERLGVEVEVVSMQPAGRVRDVPKLLVECVPVIRQLQRIMRNREIDLVHVNTSANIYGAVAARLLGLPVLWHVREMMWRRIIRWTVFRLVLACSTKIVCVSEAVKQAVLAGAKVPDDKLSVIYNGVELAEYDRPVDRQNVLTKLGISRDRIVVGTIGWLGPDKGVDVFLEAAASVAESMSETVFLIVGGGSWESNLKRLAHQLQLEDKTYFTGQQKDVVPLYQIMDLVVLPSRSEGFGKALIEGMAARKPVVATRVGGIPEIVVDQETGILVPVDDPKAMAEAIISLLQDKAIMVKLGEMGRRRVEQMFTWEISAAKVEKVYAEVLGLRLDQV